LNAGDHPSVKTKRSFRRRLMRRPVTDQKVGKRFALMKTFLQPTEKEIVKKYFL